MQPLWAPPWLLSCNVIPLRSSIVMRSGGSPAYPPFPCWSDRRSGTYEATWRSWAASTGQGVVIAKESNFPCTEWVRSVAEQVDLPTAAVQYLARRAGREPNELLAAWRAKTLADCERFWNTLTPNVDDDLLWAVMVPGGQAKVTNCGGSVVVRSRTTDRAHDHPPGPVGQLAKCFVPRGLVTRTFICWPGGRGMDHASTDDVHRGRGARASVGQLRRQRDGVARQKLPLREAGENSQFQ